MARAGPSGRWLRLGVLVTGALPVIVLAVRFVRDDLGANPVETITHETGAWALRFLLACLCVTPLRRLPGMAGLAGQRRALGLIAFFYASLHFATYLALDLDFDLAYLAEDLRERPYITVGFTAFSLLVPLAVTSNRASIRRLGKRWITLHRLVYVAAAAAIVHFFWLVKADLREPAIYAAVFAILIVVRAPAFRRARTSR